MTTVLLLLTRTESRRPHVVYVRIYASRVPLDFLYFLYSAQRLSSVLRRSRVSTSHRLSPHRREVVAPRSNALARSFFAEKRSSRRGRFLPYRVPLLPPRARARSRRRRVDGVDVLARGVALAVYFRAQTVQQSGGGARNAPRVVVRNLESRVVFGKTVFPKEGAVRRRDHRRRTRLRTQLGEFAVDRRDRRFVCEFGFLPSHARTTRGRARRRARRVDWVDSYRRRVSPSRARGTKRVRERFVSRWLPRRARFQPPRRPPRDKARPRTRAPGSLSAYPWRPGVRSPLHASSRSTPLPRATRL